MEFKVENGVVTIVCSVAQGKVLMQAANFMEDALDSMTAVQVAAMIVDMGLTVGQFNEAVEECIITLPHEDNEVWNG